MKIKKIFITLTILNVVLILLCGCNFKNQNIQENNGTSNLDSTLNIDDVNKIDEINRYKYIKGIANFVRTYKNGYVYFTDADFTETENYTGKVRWCDETGQGTIISVSQVIAINGKELYNKLLKIVSLKGDDTWDHMAEYSYTVRAKCETDENPDCYIKLVDSNNIEYHVMLTPVEKFNHDGYFGSAVYIVDKENNNEFWYDDLIKEF